MIFYVTDENDKMLFSNAPQDCIRKNATSACHTLICPYGEEEVTTFAL